MSPGNASLEYAWETQAHTSDEDSSTESHFHVGFMLRAAKHFFFLYYPLLMASLDGGLNIVSERE